jgi:hypothetical protein
LSLDQEAADTKLFTALESPTLCPMRDQIRSSLVKKDIAGDSSLLPITFRRKPAFNTFQAFE